MPNRPKALVVEDDRTTAKLAHAALTRAGYHVIVQGSALGARCALILSRYHLLLVDVNIPERHAAPESAGDGLKVAASARAISADTRVIVWSASEDPTIGERARGLGATFVAKDKGERALAKVEVLARGWWQPVAGGP